MLERKELENDVAQKSLNTTSDNVIKNIFNNLSPKQLANISSVCRRFAHITKSFPRLTNIQVAFFTQKTFILENKLKGAFKITVDLLARKSGGYDLRDFEHNFNVIKKLITDGAQVNSTGVQVIQPLVYHHVLCMEVINHWQGNDVKSNLKLAAILKKFILFLVENKIDVNEPYSGSIVDLKGMTALVYAKKFSTTSPEIAAILNEYNEVQREYKSSSPSDDNPVLLSRAKL